MGGSGRRVNYDSAGSEIAGDIDTAANAAYPQPCFRRAAS